MEGFLTIIRRGLLLATTVLTLAATGCTTIPRQNQALPAAAKQAAAKGETYQLVLQPHNGQPKMIEKPLNGTKHLQDALAENKAFRQFNRTEFELQRQTDNGGYHRMKIEHSVASRRVDPEYDYQLHPGDRIIIREDPSTIIDDIVSGVSKPLGLDKSRDSHIHEKVSAKYRIAD